MKTLPDGLIAVVKRDCPTCTLVVPVLQRAVNLAPASPGAWRILGHAFEGAGNASAG